LDASQLTAAAKRGRRCLLFLLVSVCIIATLLVVISVYQQTLRAEQLELEEKVANQTAQLQQHLLARETALAAASAAFEPVSAITPRGLSGIDREPLLGFRDLFSLVWAARVTSANALKALDTLKAHDALPVAFKMGRERIRTRPEALPKDAVVVLDILPRTEKNRSSLGLVLTSLPPARAALAEAHRTRRATATQPLELVQQPGEPSVVIYAPVVGSAQDAQDQPGFLGMSFRYSDLIGFASSSRPASALPFRVTDAQDPKRTVLYQAGDLASSSGLRVRTVRFAGRPLQIEYGVRTEPKTVAIRRALESASVSLLASLLVIGAALWLQVSQRRLDEALAASDCAQAQLQVVVQELNHRTKNMLTMVQAIVRRSLASEPGLKQACEDIDQRLHSLGQATTLLAQENWAAVSSADLLSRVMAAQDHRIVISSPDLLLGSLAAQNIAMVVHELWTNSAKHGALSVDAGRVSLTLEDQGATFRLDWRESGGPLTAAPSRKGFGRQLIETLAPRALGGVAELEFASEGLRYLLQAPSHRVIAGGRASAHASPAS
jgi:two-component sensor histidine kinase